MRPLLPLFVLLLAACGAQERPELGTVRWTRDYDQGTARAKKEDKPVFLLFQEVPG